MDATITILLIVILLTIIYYLYNNSEYKRIANEINKIPGPKSYPLIGTAWLLINVSLKDLFYVLIKISQEFKPIFRTWNGFVPAVQLTKSEYVEIVLNNIAHTEKGLIYSFLHSWLGQGLLTSSGTRWQNHRKLISPAFHIKILEKYFETFCEKSAKLVNQLNLKADGKPFDIFPLITNCTLDMICETAMGVEINAMDKSDSDYVQAIYKICENTIKRIIAPWLHNDFIYLKFSSAGKIYSHCLTILHNFTNKVIRERKEYFRQVNSKEVLTEEDILIGRKKRMAFLDLLIEASDNGNNLTDKDIREEVDTFMFAGHDTTTAALCWSLFLLGNHSDVQDKVVEELNNIFGNEDREITLNDINQMKYLERVIKESLRLYPSVPIISRILAEDVEIAGYKIPRGCEVIMHIYEIHRDPDQFPNPDVFNPDNFLPEKCLQRHPYAFIPFSAGPRNCIGQKFALLEEKTVLASILRKYKIKSVKTLNEIKMIGEIVLRPDDGLYLTLEKR